MLCTLVHTTTCNIRVCLVFHMPQARQDVFLYIYINDDEKFASLIIDYILYKATNTDICLSLNALECSATVVIY